MLLFKGFDKDLLRPLYFSFLHSFCLFPLSLSQLLFGITMLWWAGLTTFQENQQSLILNWMTTSERTVNCSAGPWDCQKYQRQHRSFLLLLSRLASLFIFHPEDGECCNTLAHQLSMTWYLHANVLTQDIGSVFVPLQCTYKSYVQKLSKVPTAS
jgi:hypothetical protein